MSKLEKPNFKKLLVEGFTSGIGWSVGVTIGFVIISTIIAFVLRSLGGLPLVGSFIANVVEETQVQLLKRSVISPY